MKLFNVAWSIQLFVYILKKILPAEDEALALLVFILFSEAETTEVGAEAEVAVLSLVGVGVKGVGVVGLSSAAL